MKLPRFLLAPVLVLNLAMVAAFSAEPAGEAGVGLAAAATAPVIVQQPTRAFPVAGGTAILSLIAEGTMPLEYQWWRNGGGIFAGTNATLVISNVQLTDVAFYQATVRNASGTATSAVVALTLGTPSARAGAFDTSFRASSTVNGLVYALAQQPDGKLVVGGYFNSLWGEHPAHVARLNTDGSLDPTFQPWYGDSVCIGICALAIQPDGKILVAGHFVNDMYRVMRLHADGRLDSTFVGEGAFSTLEDGIPWRNYLKYGITALALQPDGKILFGGDFTRVGDSSCLGVARLLPNGELDPAFDLGTDGARVAYVAALVLEPDGKILIGGHFQQVRGIAQNNLARLNPDGSLDTTFAPTLAAEAHVTRVLRLADGSYLVAAQVPDVLPNPPDALMHLRANGERDTAYPVRLDCTHFSPYSSFVAALQLQPDGRVLIGGAFDTVNTVVHGGIARLNADGSLDTTFDPGSGFLYGNTVYDLLRQPNGSLVVGGQFDSYDGFPAHNLVRVLGAPGAPPPVVATISATQPWATEQGPGRPNFQSGVFTVERHYTTGQPATSGPLSVFYQIAGSAVNAVDYTRLLGSVSFAEGASTATIDVTPLDDALVEGTETVLLTLVPSPPSPATNSYDVGEPHVATVSIQDDETAFTACPGDPDPTFWAIGSDPVTALLIQPDGRLVCGGSAGVVRRNTNGTVDAVFDSSAVVEATRLALQSDGKILAAGRSPQNYGTRVMVRFHSDGTRDSSFEAGLETNVWVTSLAVQADGKIIVGGGPTTADGFASPGIWRLNPDGSRDGSFVPDASISSQVFALLLQTDGKILVAGQHAGSVPGAVVTILRLNPDGSLDPQFSVVADEPVQCLEAHPLGGYFAAGDFQVIQGTLRRGVARLNRVYVDSIFIPAPGLDEVGMTSIDVIAPLPDGRLLIAGEFGLPPGGGSNRVGIVRLNLDGSRDPVFETLLSDVAHQEDAAPRALAVQADGRAYLGGSFDRVNGSEFLNLARLQASNRNCGGAFTFGQPMFTPRENQLSAFVSVRRTGGMLSEATLQYSTADQEAVAGLDYTAASGTLVFAPGELEQRFEVRLLDDALREGSERFTVRLTGPTNARPFRSGNPLTGTVVIVDDDAARLPGGIDSSFWFDVTPAAGGRIRGLAVESDGSVLVAGTFLGLNGLRRTGLARVRGDDFVDPLFAPVIGGGQGVNAIAVQADNKVLIGGRFDSVNGVVRRGLARLLIDGSLDSTFNPGAGLTVPAMWIEDLLVQPDGRILVAGHFDQFNGVRRLSLVRLNANGSIDTSFGGGLNPGAAVSADMPGYVYELALQPDGRILVAGYFREINGVPRSGVARLNVDGTLDTSFLAASLSNAWVNTVAVQPNGRIVVGGTFDFQPSQALTVIRLNPDGSRDASFQAPWNEVCAACAWQPEVRSVVVQPNGKILYVGQFTATHQPPEAAVGRLNTDGSLDATFFTGAGPAYGFAEKVRLDKAGRVLVAGTFRQFDLLPHVAIVRLTNDPVINTLEVTSTEDSGPGSLRDVIGIAPPNCRITFAVVGAISLTSGPIRLEKSLTLQGPGADQLTITRSQAPGTPAFRIVSIADAEVTLSGLTLSNGLAPENPDGVGGGGIWNLGTLRLYHCVLSDNQAGGNAAGGGLYSACRLTSLVVSNCTFLRNRAGAENTQGGGIYTCGPAEISDSVFVENMATGSGGGMQVGSDGTATLVRCRFVANVAAWPAEVDASGDGGGLGIRGTATVSDCVFSNNVALGRGGGLDLETPGVAVVSRCRFIGNRATSTEPTDPNGEGGGASVHSQATFTDCLFQENLVHNRGGGLYVGHFGTVLVTGCTFATNRASALEFAGYPFGQGGGIYNAGILTATNDTLSGNVADETGGAVHVDMLAPLTTLESATLTDNTAPHGSGVFAYDYYSIAPGTNQVRNTILAGNHGGADLENDGALVRSGGYNLFGRIAGTPPAGPGDQFGVTAAFLGLQPLQDNGGLTPTCALLPFSPALNAGATNGFPATDQRGFVRPFGARCDIGAVESESAGVTPPVIAQLPSNQTVMAGLSTAFEVLATGTEPLAYHWQHNGVFLPGATNAALYLDRVSDAQAGTYCVLVSHATGATSSPPATLTVLSAPTGPGSVDLTFPNLLGWLGPDVDRGPVVYALVRQPDGKILVAGFFDHVLGEPRYSLARLLPGGALDPSFNEAAIGPLDSVNRVALQPDGKILIAGRFTPTNQPARAIARLNSDGTFDPSFASTIDPDWGVILDLAVQPDGKILVAGAIAVDGFDANMVRLNPDGSRDSSFTPVPLPVDIRIVAFGLQPSGQIVAVGTPMTPPPDLDSSTNVIARFNADGSRDNGFEAGLRGYSASCLLVLPDGSLFVGGKISEVWDGAEWRACNQLVRLHPNGQLDASFASAAPCPLGVSTLAIQPDGKLVVGCQHGGVSRLHPDGQLDPAFTVGTITPEFGGTSGINAILLQNDGRVLVGGAFAAYNDVLAYGLVQLNNATDRCRLSVAHDAETGALSVCVSGPAGPPFSVWISHDLQSWVPLSLMLTNGQCLQYSSGTIGTSRQTFYRVQSGP